MASRAKGDDSEPQEDDELTEQYDMSESKLNSTTNGLTANGRPSKAAEMRDNLKRAKAALLSDRHYQIHAILLLVILFLAIILIYVSSKLLVISFAHRDPVCLSGQCLLASARIASSVNNSVDSCDNFFEYACGNWRHENQLTDNQGHYSVNQQVSDAIHSDMRRYLDQVLPTASSNDPHYKVKRFFESCMALEDIDVLSLNYFKHDIQKVGGWNIMGGWNGHDWNQAVAVERLQVLYGVDVFFKIDVGADDLDPELPYIIKIYPSGLGLPRSYYFDAKYKNVVNAYKEYMAETVKIFGGTKLDSSQFAENTFNYEKRIAEITPDKSEYLQPFNMFKRRFSIRELKLIAPSIKWTDVLQKYFQKARLNDNTRVLLAFEPYFRNVSNIISTTDNRGINDYLVWKMITAYAPYLSKDFRLVARNFNQARYGMPLSHLLDDEHRWKFCIEATSKYMGYALSSLYISNRIGEISNRTIQAKSDIINSIRETILKNTDLFAWSKGEEARRLISMKLKKMEIFVGQPNFVMKWTTLVDYYNEFMIQVKFLENIIESIDHRHKKMEMLLNEKRPVDYSWPILPHQVTVAYDYASNRLYVPFAMLKLPFFSTGELQVLQFGGLGFQVASSMLRAFDLVGLYYGLPDGRLSANGTFAQSAPFQAQLTCLQDYLSGYPLRANETLSQTYTDIGALKVAWLAYKDFVSKTEKQGIRTLGTLPSLSYSLDEIFFLSFSQSLCATSRPAYKDYLSESTSQLVDASHRVNVILRQSDIFANTFACPPETFRRQRCSLWR